MSDHHSSSPSFPFFNHSATTLPNNLPPSVDDKPAARQKRKRTSPEDQAVLEAYYVRDPKPDKAARLDLVKKVALDEKEVQIWFQNRRQSSRRKSRPLLPHEIAQYQLSKSAAASNPSSSASDPDSFHDTIQTGPQQRCGSNQGMLQVAKDHDAGSSPDQSTARTSFQHSEYVTSFDAPLTGVGLSGPVMGRADMPVFPGDHSQGTNVPLQGHHGKSRSPRHSKKSSSIVWLSMNSDGGAVVTAKDTSSPSPPRAVSSQPGLGIIGASATPQAAALQDHTTTTTTGAALRRAPSGRSRDSRAWEFWCDKDCRNELEEKAEKDASGSAADAIQLLRSASGRSILGAIPAKRNSALLGHSNSSKRLRRDGRTAVQRSSTSNGRLQGKQLGGIEPGRKPTLKNSKSALSVRIPGNDSDKENWSPISDLQPDEQSIVVDGETVDQASREKSSQHSTGPYTLEERQLNAHHGSIDPENDPEIAAFMRAGRESDKVSDHEELDCVQGLLSLSQGNWR